MEGMDGARRTDFADVSNRWKQSRPKQDGLEQISEVLWRVLLDLGIEHPAETQLELLTPAA